MNIVLSFFQPTNRDPDPRTGLTSRDKYLVKKSFDVMKKESLKYGIALFLGLFKKKPEYQQLFPFRDTPYEELSGNRRFHAHCTSVMYAMCSIVDSLDNVDLLIEILKKQGEAHKPRGVETAAYDVLHEALIDIVKEEFDENTVNSWNKTLTVAFTIIKEAANQF